MPKRSEPTSEERPFVFCVMPIGGKTEAVRRWSDGILNEIIRAAFPSDEFRVERADDDSAPKPISANIFEKLIKADLVVAELSHMNPNVFLELGVRFAYNRPVIQLVREDVTVPFDIQDQNTVFYMDDLAGRAEVVGKLKKSYAAIKDKDDWGNPISRALNYMQLSIGNGQTEDRYGKMFEAIMSRLDSMQSSAVRRSNAGQQAEDELMKQLISNQMRIPQIVKAQKQGVSLKMREVVEGLERHGLEVEPIDMSPSGRLEMYLQLNGIQRHLIVSDCANLALGLGPAFATEAILMRLQTTDFKADPLRFRVSPNGVIAVES